MGRTSIFYARTGKEGLLYCTQGQEGKYSHILNKERGKDFYILHKEWRERTSLYYTRSGGAGLTYSTQGVS